MALGPPCTVDVSLYQQVTESYSIIFENVFNFEDPVHYFPSLPMLSSIGMRSLCFCSALGALGIGMIEYPIGKLRILFGSEFLFSWLSSYHVWYKHIGKNVTLSHFKREGTRLVNLSAQLEDDDDSRDSSRDADVAEAKANRSLASRLFDEDAGDNIESSGWPGRMPRQSESSARLSQTKIVNLAAQLLDEEGESCGVTGSLRPKSEEAGTEASFASADSGGPRRTEGSGPLGAVTQSGAAGSATSGFELSPRQMLSPIKVSDSPEKCREHSSEGVQEGTTDISKAAPLDQGGFPQSIGKGLQIGKDTV
eukprot:CAMPEP_0184293474 /NCGR_PEP_ID=MMETSP1049-20130417/4895_1 /TAXON_ID=77928 /ORGANISM="Proteomonas sulcata, Strain CCMP704" /LENGTH=308 /DNA_ID=CAMNT_0026601457 /DNA_START=1 /DNA_END=928 /DNA_ORIENTATION=-